MLYLCPDLFVQKIEDITIETLRSLSVENILLDIDDTISPSGVFFISSSVKTWIEGLKSFSVNFVLLSNNSFDRVNYFADSLGIDCVCKAMKPLPFRAFKAMDLIGAKRENTAIVGDQIFTDVLSAKILGVKSILAEPLSYEGDWLLKFKRRIEFLIKNKYKSKA